MQPDADADAIAMPMLPKWKVAAKEMPDDEPTLMKSMPKLMRIADSDAGAANSDFNAARTDAVASGYTICSFPRS